jgi:hypothetical protein
MARVFNSIKEGRLPAAVGTPEVVDGAEIKDLLRDKGVLPDRADPAGRLARFLKDGPVKVSALYVADPEPLLLAFEIDPKSRDQNDNPVGVVAGLTGDADLGALFPATSASARVFRASKSSVKVLRKYVGGRASPKAKLSRWPRVSEPSPSRD